MLDCLTDRISIVLSNGTFVNSDFTSKENTCKKGTLKTLVQRTYTVCSTDQYLQNELDHLKNVFHMKNGYPKWVINQVLDQVKAEQQENALPNEHINSQDNQGQPVIN